ncbi:translation initiation factor 2 [uncultured Mobiluncus sp.]|uniref:translation initiation factor 2 n=1 Tax=uncultured Mobiluncus sp. TaxID=293425 RepID=UPI002804865A|nr:translation initiation factor 2 [uncultured Mobiluncus sp.]
MFDVWLTFPSNGVAWAFQIFTKYGPLPVMLAIFIIMVPFRPQVPKAIPMHYRRALLQLGWTLRVALSFALIAVMHSPAALISLYNSGFLTQNAFNSMNTMLVLVVGVAFQLPYLLMVHVWFPRPLNWVPNRNWVISPRFRVRAWIVYILIWMVTEIMMVVGGVVFETPNASISGEEIMAAAGYYLVEGVIFVVMSVYIQYRISWRNPIPGVPLAVDMALRREDLNNVQKFATFILGAGVSRCLQFLAQLQYESGPFAISAVSLVLSWVVSITSLGIACIPTWWFMRKLDPSRRLMKELRSNVMSEKRDPNLFTLENYRNMLDYNEDELIKGSIPQPRKNYIMSVLDSPRKDLLTAPGSGSSPEEVAQAFTYMSKVAARAGVGLNPEERKGLAEIREAVRELVEHRVALNEGVASNLIPINPDGALAQDGEHGHTVQLPEGQTEDGEPLDSSLAHLLGQSVNDTAVGLDSQTLQEWGEFYKEKDAMERQEKAWEKQKEMQELAIKTFGFDPYAYDPYGYANPYGNAYGGYANPYEDFGTDPYAQPYASGYGYGTSNPYADLYADGYADPYGGYGYDPYGYNAAGYWQMNPNMAGAYGAYPWGWPNGAPTIPNPQPYGYLDAGGTNGAASEAPGNPAAVSGVGPEGSMFPGQSAAGPQSGAFPVPDDPLSSGGMGTGEANPANNWPGGGPQNAALPGQSGGPQVPGFGGPAGPGVPGSAPGVPGAPMEPSVPMPGGAPVMPGAPTGPGAPAPGGAPLGPGMAVPGAPAGVGAPVPNNPTNHVNPVNPAAPEQQTVAGYPFVVRTMEGYPTVGAPVAPSLHPLVNLGQPDSQVPSPQANFGQPGPQVPGVPVNPGQPVAPIDPRFPQNPGLVNAAGPNVPRPAQPYAPVNTEAAEEAIDPRAVYPPTFAKPRPAPRQYEEFVEDEAEIEELP